MKKLLLTIIVLACSANLAFAQNGSVGLFSVNDGTNCEYFDVAPGLASIYAVWVGHGGGTAIQFRAVMPACFTAAVWLSDTAIWPVTIGPSQVGVAVGFGQCVPAPVHVLTINVFAQGIAQSCCYWGVDGDPALPSGEIEGVDCSTNLIFATGGELIVNPQSGCNCDVSENATTWGAIKSVYE
jgi:hypothetical protein